MEDKEAFAKAKQTCWRLLALRDHGEGELSQKLGKRGFDHLIITEVIDYFRELGYLNDQTYAYRQARRLAIGKGYGNRRIAAALLEKGLPDSIVGEAIKNVRQEWGEKQAIASLMKKKTASGNIHDDPKEKQRLVRYLFGKGFPPELIFETINRPEEENRHDDDSK